MKDFSEDLKKLPGQPGVYIMRDEQDAIIYVGKAVNLHNRVRSYFRKIVGRGPQNDRMVKQIDRFEYIVTDSDELLVFQGMEEHSLSDLVKVLIPKGYKRIKGLTLDAYPEGKLFGKSEDIRKDYKWIDSDGYKEVDSVDKIKQFIGGPRYRLMK